MAPVPPSIRSVGATDTRMLDARQPLAPAVQEITIPTSNDIPHHRLEARQQGGIVPIPTVYQGLNSGPAPGAVVGIVLGSVLGFIFLIWLLWILSNGSTFIRTNRDEEEDMVVTRQHRERTSDRRRSRRTEMSEKNTNTRRSPRRDRVYRQERITRDFPAPARSPGTSRVRGETVFVDDPPRTERRVDGDDIVEVIEEHSSVGGGGPPRRKSKRASSGYRSVSNFPSPQPPGGFRPVDPDLYAGGNYPQRSVR